MTSRFPGSMSGKKVTVMDFRCFIPIVPLWVPGSGGRGVGG